MHTHSTDTPSLGSFEILDAPEFDEEFWKKRRTEALRKFHEMMEEVDAVSTIRCTTNQDVRSGKDTFSDLFRANLHLNGISCRTRGRTVYDASTPVDREIVFPRNMLCKHMGETAEWYQGIDIAEKRRDIFFVLHSLFEEGAQNSTYGEKLQVPHMLLLEELTTTLHQGGISGFPMLEALKVAHRGEEFAHDKPRIDVSVPDRKEIILKCTSPNTVHVYAKCWTPRWLCGGVTTILQYDLSLIPAKGTFPDCILYDGIKALATFPGNVEGRSEPHSKDPLLNSEHADPAIIKNTASIVYDPSEAQGFSVIASFASKALTASSMLLPMPHMIPVAQIPTAEREIIAKSSVTNIAQSSLPPTKTGAVTTNKKVAKENLSSQYANTKPETPVSATFDDASPATNTKSVASENNNAAKLEQRVTTTDTAKEPSHAKTDSITANAALNHNAGDNRQPATLTAIAEHNYAADADTVDITIDTASPTSEDSKVTEEVQPTYTEPETDDASMVHDHSVSIGTASPESENQKVADIPTDATVSPRTANMTLSSIHSEESQNIDEQSQSADKQRRSFWDKIREFFVSIGHGVQRLLTAIKNTFRSRAASEEETPISHEYATDEQPRTTEDSIAAPEELTSTVPEEQHTRQTETPQKEEAYNVPGSVTSSVDVSQSGEKRSSISKG